MAKKEAGYGYRDGSVESGAEGTLDEKIVLVLIRLPEERQQGLMLFPKTLSSTIAEGAEERDASTDDSYAGRYKLHSLSSISQHVDICAWAANAQSQNSRASAPPIAAAGRYRDALGRLADSLDGWIIRASNPHAVLRDDPEPLLQGLLPQHAQNPGDEPQHALAIGLRRAHDDDARIVGGRVGADVSEVQVERHERTPFGPAPLDDARVGRATPGSRRPAALRPAGR